jgi:hypothetical protein
LYLVPVVPYGTDEYLLCPICNRGLQLKDGQQAAVSAIDRLHRAGELTDEKFTATVAS